MYMDFQYPAIKSGHEKIGLHSVLAVHQLQLFAKARSLSSTMEIIGLLAKIALLKWHCTYNVSKSAHKIRQK